MLLAMFGERYKDPCASILPYPYSLQMRCPIMYLEEMFAKLLVE